jgi:hypothetical protein
MRTTLTIDDDVAVEIEQLRHARKTSFKAIVNEALRRGLADLASRRKAPKAPFRTQAHDPGGLKVPISDSVSEMLVIEEGEAFR